MRNNIVLVLLLFWLPLMAWAEKDEPAVVILTAGQSNTDGRVVNEELPDSIKNDGYKYLVMPLYSKTRYTSTPQVRCYWEEGCMNAWRHIVF